MFEDGNKRGVRPDHARKLVRILDLLDGALSPDELNFPGSFLHPLKGDLKGFYAAMRTTLTTSTTTKDLQQRRRAPSHPGQILRDLYLEALGLSTIEFAEAIAVSRKTVSKLINQRGSITPDMALRLSIAFQTTPQLWLNLQQNYDLWHAHRKAKHLKKIRRLAA